MTSKKIASLILGIYLSLQGNLAFAETSPNETIQAYDNEGRLIENWEIKSFNSEIYLNTDSSADIKETITADFSKEAHRGIV
jgi:hypothetical protein